MSRRYKWFFTEEWDEGGTVHVAAYGQRKRSEIASISDQMERYSPYDYTCPNESDTEEEYKSRLQARIKNGAEVKYFNQ
jgi:hypothetical protein